MRQHFKGIIWPRESILSSVKNGKKKNKQNVYRYVITGILVTDEPIDKFEGKDELVLDGPTNTLVEPLVNIKSRNSKLRIGDATNVLLNLKDL